MQTTATVRHPTWGNSTAVRREMQGFADMCSGKTEFATALNRYLAVYKHALDPSVPPEEKRILVRTTNNYTLLLRNVDV
jgi:hypothetical protein